MDRCQACGLRASPLTPIRNGLCCSCRFPPHPAASQTDADAAENAAIGHSRLVLILGDITRRAGLRAELLGQLEARLHSPE